MREKHKRNRRKEKSIEWTLDNEKNLPSGHYSEKKSTEWTLYSTVKKIYGVDTRQ